MFVLIYCLSVALPALALEGEHPAREHAPPHSSSGHMAL